MRRLQKATRLALKAAKRRVPWPYILGCTATWRDILGPAAESTFRLEVAAPERPERFLDRAESAFRSTFEQALALPPSVQVPQAWVGILLWVSFAVAWLPVALSANASQPSTSHVESEGTLTQILVVVLAPTLGTFAGGLLGGLAFGFAVRGKAVPLGGHAVLAWLLALATVVAIEWRFDSFAPENTWALVGAVATVMALFGIPGAAVGLTLARRVARVDHDLGAG